MIFLFTFSLTESSKIFCLFNKSLFKFSICSVNNLILFLYSLSIKLFFSDKSSDNFEFSSFKVEIVDLNSFIDFSFSVDDNSKFLILLFNDNNSFSCF